MALLINTQSVSQSINVFKWLK